MVTKSSDTHIGQLAAIMAHIGIHNCNCSHNHAHNCTKIQSYSLTPLRDLNSCLMVSFTGLQLSETDEFIVTLITHAYAQDWIGKEASQLRI